MKASKDHLSRIGQAVGQSRNVTGSESTGPMRLFQLTPEPRSSVGDPSEWEEAILEVTRQKGTVLQVRDRLSLGVQNPLYALDDLIAIGQEELEQFDMCLERHLAGTRPGWPFVRREERMKGHAVKHGSFQGSSNAKRSPIRRCRGGRQSALVT
jgi:hypothetical protein